MLNVDVCVMKNSVSMWLFNLKIEIKELSAGEKKKTQITHT